jgi:3,4-dihydroxy 2-butanone 4-phosphate synthase / GTP cyclohydrolase II
MPRSVGFGAFFMSGSHKKTAEAREGLDPLPEVVQAFGRGELVVVADDERRENEGDLIVAAEKVTPEAINFMIRFGRGLVCVAMEREQLARLGLSRMVPHGDGDPFRTAFMESVDARYGVSTGISAQDRARTISILLDEHSTAADLVRPGHVFPLEAVEGGVLRRAGHTEAAVDLARMAGLRPAGAICEILKDDGSMARTLDLAEFARHHGLRFTSVSAIAADRRRREKLVELEQDVNFPTDLGLFRLKMYRAILDERRHLALVIGDPAAQAEPIVRIHSECLTGDAFGSLRCDCGSQLREAMQMIAREEHGALLYMRQEGRGIGLVPKIHAYALQDRGLDTVQANEQLGFGADERDYSVAAQILEDLGIRRVRLITNNPRKIAGLEDFGIEVAERIPLALPSTIYNARYIETKKKKLGHLF